MAARGGEQSDHEETNGQPAGKLTREIEAGASRRPARDLDVSS